MSGRRRWPDEAEGRDARGSDRDRRWGVSGGARRQLHSLEMLQRRREGCPVALVIEERRRRGLGGPRWQCGLGLWTAHQTCFLLGASQGFRRGALLVQRGRSSSAARRIRVLGCLFCGERRVTTASSSRGWPPSRGEARKLALEKGDDCWPQPQSPGESWRVSVGVRAWTQSDAPFSLDASRLFWCLSISVSAFLLGGRRLEIFGRCAIKPSCQKQLLEEGRTVAQRFWRPGRDARCSFPRRHRPSRPDTLASQSQCVSLRADLGLGYWQFVPPLQGPSRLPVGGGGRYCLQGR